jgi:hypothetical protein
MSSQRSIIKEMHLTLINRCLLLCHRLCTCAFFVVDFTSTRAWLAQHDARGKLLIVIVGALAAEFI